MPETVKIKIDHYTMKMRLYPNQEQSDKIDLFFRALHVAYNITFHEVFQKNPLVCGTPNQKGDVWPDFKKMANAEWKKHLVEVNSIVAEAPSHAIAGQSCLFLKDGKDAWKKGMRNRPISDQMRKDFQFYNARNPRRSFKVQIRPQKLTISEKNDKVARIGLPKIEGTIKARGFNRKLWFGEDGRLTYEEALRAGALGDITVCVRKDSCGDYFISVTFVENKKKGCDLYLEVPAQPKERPPVGMDVGIKDVAILSDGEKISNQHFKKQKDGVLRKLNRELSGRWGPANEAYRDYNRVIRDENKAREPDEKLPLSVPSKRYTATQHKKAVIERRIARRRETYYHQQTALLVRNHGIIAVETLRVKNMLRNRRLAFALSDAAMNDFVSKLEYKAQRAKNTQIIPIGVFEPSSQICSCCGYKNEGVKNLSIRQWRCPNCGVLHDRDINAAKNILSIALERGAAADPEIESQDTQKKKTRGNIKRKPGETPISEQHPEIVVQYSKELSREYAPRYIIVNNEIGCLVDDANGAGFRTISNAKNCYKAKKAWSQKR